MTESQKNLLQAALRKREGEEKKLASLPTTPEAARLAADIERRVSTFRVGQSLRERYAALYADPINGQDLEDRIDEDIKNAIHGVDELSGKAY